MPGDGGAAIASFDIGEEDEAQVPRENDGEKEAEGIVTSARSVGKPRVRRKERKGTSHAAQRLKIALPEELVLRWKQSGLTYRENIMIECLGILPRKASTAYGNRAMAMLLKGPGGWLKIPEEHRTQEMFDFLRSGDGDWLRYACLDLGRFAGQVTLKQWTRLCSSDIRYLRYVPDSCFDEVAAMIRTKKNQ